MYRPQRSFLVLAILVLGLLALPISASAKSKRKSVKAQVKVSSISAIGKHVQPIVLTKFVPPKSVSIKRACTGKVTAKAPIGKVTRRVHGKRHRVTKYAKQSIKVERVLGHCSATLAPKVPLKLTGKTLHYKIDFSGNKAIKGFQKTPSVPIKNPPSVIPGLVASKPVWVGFWYARLPNQAPGTWPVVSFYMSPGPALYGAGFFTIVSNSSPNGIGSEVGIPFRCDAEGLNVASGIPAFVFESGEMMALPFFSASTPGSPFSFAHPPVPPISTGPSFGGDMVSTVQFDVLSPTSMRIQVTASGTIMNTADRSVHHNCHTEGPVTLIAEAETSGWY